MQTITYNTKNMTFTEICASQQAAWDKDVQAVKRAAEQRQRIFIRKLADVTSRSEATVTTWVKYGRKPKPKAMEAIAKYLGRPVQELFPNETEG